MSGRLGAISRGIRITPKGYRMLMLIDMQSRAAKRSAIAKRKAAKRQERTL